MTGTRRLLAVAMAFSMGHSPGSGKADAFGIVAQADHASLGSLAASEGTTIYDGDRLSTEASGSLQVVFGEAIVYLAEQSSVIVHNDGSGAARELEAELVSGTAVLSETARTAGEIAASSARVRPTAKTRGVVQVRLVGPHELIVFARRGPAQISYRDESETIAEGKCYRVLLNAAQDAGSAEPSPKAPGKGRKVLILIAIGAGVAGIILPTVLRGSGGGVESPDRP